MQPVLSIEKITNILTTMVVFLTCHLVSMQTLFKRLNDKNLF